MAFIKIPLHELSFENFEDLCFDLLNKTNEYTNIIRNSNRYGFDFLGTQNSRDNGKTDIAIEAKHWLHFKTQPYLELLEKVTKSSETVSIFILITSAKISSKDKKTINEINARYKSIVVKIIDFSLICDLINNNLDIKIRYFPELKKRTLQANIALSLIIIGLLISGTFTYLGITQKGKSTNNLTSRIETVETTLDSIKDLEIDLEKIKEEIIKTDFENQRIRKEYDDAIELKKITDEQIETINLAFKRKNLKDTIYSHIAGFFWGIISSISASFLYNRISTRVKFYACND